MSGMISNNENPLFDIYHLIWQPGFSLHPDWWTNWGLPGGQCAYASGSWKLRRQIDEYILEKQALPVWSPSNVTDEHSRLLAIKNKLPLLLVSLGLISLGSCNYFFYRPYRKQLETLFTPAQLKQLSLLIRVKTDMMNINHEQLLPLSLSTGEMMITRQLKNDPLWNRLKYTYPRVNCIPIKKTFSDEPLQAMLRLEKFL